MDQHTVSMFNIADELHLCTYEPRDEGNHSDGEHENQMKVPKRTPMACQFCRGRKLKCDGRPTCGHCQRRGIVCIYVPVSAQK
ncbi:hypothetical protein A0H81_05509 [Grifola frondosa]|uniref:Zn(2)-C6 fungal-type domain-containing protein n=1 Tax=Grifola frondosa TaxID=5627 RepID=A0A1C7MCW0_GRIFR|nr:hypothetical protein A0H81_05509 [Grifola frondosa]